MSKNSRKACKPAPTFEFGIPRAQKKLEELILYIAKKCQNDPSYGATKLNKILYFSDFYNYANHGSGITGIEYMKLDQGPVPQRLVPTRKKMQNRGDIAIQSLTVADGFVQQRVVALRDPDLSVFSATELDTVHMVIDALKFKNAKGVSELSHGRAWRVAGQQEAIPYESFWISDEDITPYDHVLTEQLVRDGELCLTGDL